MNYFEQKVYNYIQTHGLIEPGNRLVVGVSGGADSVCLLRVLKALMPVLHIPSQGIVVVHVHHGIRGAEADHDAAFTKDLCAKLLQVRRLLLPLQQLQPVLLHPPEWRLL